MKKIMKTLAFFIVVVFLFMGASCTKDTNTNTNVPIASPQGNDVGMLPTEVVDLYMHLTLGSIPQAEIDYEAAKSHLTDDLKTQFVNPMFIPVSYCIQDGPEEVRIISDEITGSVIEVVVEGQYGGAWQEMWNFSLVSDGDLSWLIQKITCLN
ncbi:hypothetical protein K8R42_04295 [bacterium]|nr:hypothetical protein [bacterium]